MNTLNDLIDHLTRLRDESPAHGDAPVMLWPKFPQGKAVPVTGAVLAGFGPHRWVVLDESKPVDPMAP